MRQVKHFLGEKQENTWVRSKIKHWLSTLSFLNVSCVILDCCDFARLTRPNRCPNICYLCQAGQRHCPPARRAVHAVQHAVHAAQPP